MPRKKPLKTPFVVTVSVAVAATFAVACGGKVGGSPSGDTESVPPPYNPPSPHRPSSCTSSTLPGDECFPGEAACSAAGYGTGGSDPLQCVNGHWVGPAIGNPPPPGCSPSEPRADASCAMEGTYCEYADRCAERPIGSTTNRSFVCAKGVWQRKNPYFGSAACPAQMPLHGTSCDTCGTDYPAECMYPDGTACPPPRAVCDPKTLTWTVSVSSCNPPPPDAGGAGGENGP